jgi:hypothetical protein
MTAEKACRYSSRHRKPNQPTNRAGPTTVQSVSVIASAPISANDNASTHGPRSSSSAWGRRGFNVHLGTSRLIL